MKKTLMQAIGWGAFLALSTTAFAAPAHGKNAAKNGKSPGATAAKPAPQATPAANAPGQAPSIGGNLSALFGSGFHSLLAVDFNSTPDGQVEIKAGVRKDGSYQPVIVATDQLNLECAFLTVDPKTNVMTATGSPVKIRQGEINAECKKYIYDTQKKVSTLTQNPVVLQKSGNQVTRLTSDVIVLTQDAAGKMGIHMKMDENNPNNVTQIVVLPSDDKKASATQPKSSQPPAKKAEGAAGLKLIKMPGM
jgi:lipopolysaccharide export system protein LptA